MPTSLSIANASVTEGSTGGTTNIVFRVTRTGDVGNEASTVNYTIGAGTATAADFAGGSLPSGGSLSFAAGETEKLVTVQVLADLIDEADETFTVTLSGASTGTTIGTATATGTILDDDVAGSVSINSVTVVETNGTTAAVLTITRTGGNAPFTVDYATGGGTATAGTDYTTATGTVTFGANETTKTISIPIVGDTTQEAQETFNVTLSNPTGGATVAGGGAGVGTVTINDDDVLFAFAAASASIAEGSSNATVTPTNLTFTVNRTGSTDAAATLTYTITNGATGLTATDASDFAGATTGQVQFAAGAATAIVTVPITADFVAESNEGFTVTLSNPSIGAITPSGATATGQITNDDTAGNVAFGAGPFTVTEGSGGTTTIEIPIVRTGGTGAPLSVTVLSADNSAIAGSDYTAVNQTVTFAANQATAYVTVTVNPDYAVESSESFFLSLANPTSGAVVGGSTTVTLNDDDSVGGILIGGTSVNEDAGVTTFTVTRTSGSAPFTVNYATSDGTAVAGSDYAATSGTLTFVGGQTTATITVPIVNDTTVEQGETFTMTISSITGGGSISIAQATITINDNDGSTGGVVTPPVVSGSEVYVSASYVLPADSTATLLSTRVNSATDAINLTGNVNAQNIIGNFGANVLNGGGGGDTLQGLAGNDSYIVNATNVIVVEAGGDGTDTVQTSVDYVLGVNADVETLSVFDPTTTTSTNLTGSTASQTITGNAGANIINGFGGADTMVGLGGDDTFLVRGPGDVVIENNGGGSDTVFTTVSYNLGVNEVERLSTVIQADTTDINLIGNFTTQAVIGNYGANVLNGGSGGLDTLIGLRGNDIYAVGDSRTVIIENDGEGSDTLVTSVDYALAAGVSVEVLAAQNRGGTEALTLRGNAFAQTVVGNDGANTIDGGGGNDTLVGGGGADRFAFTTALAAGNVDSIVDFQVGADRIGLASDIFGAVGSSLSAAAFTTGTAATTADQRIVYNQTSGQLFYDADGSGAGAAVLFAQLQPGTALTAASFEVIAPVALV